MLPFGLTILQIIQGIIVALIASYAVDIIKGYL